MDLSTLNSDQCHGRLFANRLDLDRRNRGQTGIYFRLFKGSLAWNFYFLGRLVPTRMENYYLASVFCARLLFRRHDICLEILNLFYFRIGRIVILLDILFLFSETLAHAKSWPWQWHTSSWCWGYSFQRHLSYILLSFSNSTPLE